MKKSILKNFRRSHQRCSVRKGVFKIFAKFTRKYLCQNLFFNKVSGLRPVTLLKKRLWYNFFTVKFAKFLRAPFLQNTSGWLLLEFGKIFIEILNKHRPSKGKSSSICKAIMRRSEWKTKYFKLKTIDTLKAYKKAEKLLQQTLQERKEKFLWKFESVICCRQ